MYEFLILAQLSRFPMHGYKIAKIIGAMTGPCRQVQWGALYPVLNRLVGEGLIQAEEEGDDGDGRLRKVYALNDAGRTRLHEHLLDTERHQGEYETYFAHKVAFFHLLTRGERVRLCRHYAVYAQRNIDHLEAHRREIESPDHPLPLDQKKGVLVVMQHASEHWIHERGWAESLIAQYLPQEAL